MKKLVIILGIVILLLAGVFWYLKHVGYIMNDYPQTNYIDYQVNGNELDLSYSMYAFPLSKVEGITPLVTFYSGLGCNKKIETFGPNKNIDRIKWLNPVLIGMKLNDETVGERFELPKNGFSFKFEASSSTPPTFRGMSKCYNGHKKYKEIAKKADECGAEIWDVDMENCLTRKLANLDLTAIDKEDFFNICYENLGALADDGCFSSLGQLEFEKFAEYCGKTEDPDFCMRFVSQYTVSYLGEEELFNKAKGYCSRHVSKTDKESCLFWMINDATRYDNLDVQKAYEN